MQIRKNSIENSLVVQQLGLCASTVAGRRYNPWSENSDPMPLDMAKKKKSIKVSYHIISLLIIVIINQKICTPVFHATET